MSTTINNPNLSGLGLPVPLTDALRQVFAAIQTLQNSITTAASMAGIQVIQDKHVNRNLLYPAGSLPVGSFYIETDRGALYVNRVVSQANAWVWLDGVMYGTLANRPADLGLNDVGFVYSASNARDYRWDGANWIAMDDVRGGTTLLDIGAIPKVTALGILGESAMTDDGSRIVIVSRVMLFDNTQGLQEKDSAGTARAILYLGGENPDILHIRNNQRGAGGNINFESMPAAGVGLAIDNAGNVGATASLGIGTSPVIHATEVANTVLAGPATGAGALPTFRALTAADVPGSGDATTINGAAVPLSAGLLGSNASRQLIGVTGVTHTVVLAKLTTLGANGSIAFSNGLPVTIVDPT
jgi:hypothetical protein